MESSYNLKIRKLVHKFDIKTQELELQFNE